MKNLLVKASIDYADEFDCKMFGVFTEEKWNEVCENAKKRFAGDSSEDDSEDDDSEDSGTVEIYFGTNEALEFDSYNQWFKKMKITEISADEAEFLKKHFGKTFGTGSGALTLGY